MKEVAATYETWERKGQPFSDDGAKYYIIVVNPKTGKEKTVRWYGEVMPDYKHILGFDNGYITVFRGINAANRDFFAASNARYAWFFGWYVVSTEEIPTLPSGIEAKQLWWRDDFKNAAARKQATEELIGAIYEE